MSHLIFIVVNHLEDILRHGGYWVIGVVSVIEALPLIGSIIPGHTIVIFGGFFAHLGFLNVYWVTFWAAFGAIVGDITGFLLGRKYGLSLITDWSKYFLLKQQHIDKAREALKSHSGKAIILGRFNPIARVYIPFLAGASGVHIRKFWMFDAVGSILWASISVGAGYVFGASFEIISHTIGKFTTVGIVLAILIVASYYFVNSRRHIFAKYDFHILIVCIISLYFFFKTVEDVIVAHPFMADIDVAINLIMSAHVIPWLVMFMTIVTDLFSPTVLGIVSVAIAAWWIHKKHWHNVYIYLVSFPVGLGLGYLLKLVVGRERPPIDTRLIQETGYSFPSGHALAAALFFTLIIYFFVRHIKGRYTRELFLALNVFFIVLTCFSRLYLGVHWFSDVVAGSMFGVFWVTFSILVVRYTEGLIRGRGAKKVQ